MQTIPMYIEMVRSIRRRLRFASIHSTDSVAVFRTVDLIWAQLAPRLGQLLVQISGPEGAEDEATEAGVSHPDGDENARERKARRAAKTVAVVVRVAALLVEHAARRPRPETRILEDVA